MPSHKRILFVTTVPQALRAFLLPYARYWRNQGWRVDALSSNMGHFKELNDYFDKTWSTPFSRNPFSFRHIFSILRDIRQLVEQQNYDYVHVHTPIAAFLTRFSLRKLRPHGPTIIYTAHGFHFYRGGNPIKNALFLIAEKLAGKWTDHLIVINGEDASAARKFSIVPRENLHYMPGIGVDLTRYNENGVSAQAILDFRQSLNLNPDDKIFLMIAEFTPQKNHKLIIEAASQLQDPCVHFVFAGDGKTLPTLKKRVSARGLEGRVHFLGFRQDISVLIHSSTAVLLVSQREGLPRCLMEAMCFKKPIIGTNIRGIRDLIRKDGGILIPPNSSEDLIKSINYILANPQIARNMGNKGFERVRKYEFNKILKRHERIYGIAIKD